MLVRILLASALCVTALIGGVAIGQTRILPYQYIVQLQQELLGYNISVNTSYDVLDTIYTSRPKDKITLIGDSHVQYGDWQRLLQRADVANLGIGGERSSQLRERLHRYDLTASVIVISIGTNDIGNMRLEDSDANTRAIIAEAAKKAQHVILLAPPPSLDMRFNARVKVLREQQRRACSETCFYLDLTEPLSTAGLLRPDFSADGVHLKDAGYQIIATALRSEIARQEGHRTPTGKDAVVSLE